MVKVGGVHKIGGGGFRRGGGFPIRDRRVNVYVHQWPLQNLVTEGHILA